jgi:hypothetical protein
MRTLRIFATGLFALAMLISVGSVRAEVSEDNGDLRVTLYNFPGDLAEYPFDRKPWETGGLAGFTQCDELATDNIDDFFGDEVPFGSAHCYADNFLARFIGTISVPTSGSYEFAKSSDDGFTLFINGTTLIQDWGEEHGMDWIESGPIELTEGQTYSFEAWFYDGCCGAGAQLLASFEGDTWNIIPSTWFGEGGDPSITEERAGKLVGSTTAFAFSRVQWAWMSCTSAGGPGEGRRLPNDCRVTASGSGQGSVLKRKPYRVTSRDRSRGYIRVAIKDHGTWYYSDAFDVRP